MIQINSSRGRALLESPKFIKAELGPMMKRFPGDDLVLWAQVERDQHIVKNLSFYGKLEAHQILLLESMASLLIGRPISFLDQLSLRECEAFLRDRNSVPALVGMTEADEEVMKKVFLWLRKWPLEVPSREYHFPSEKGPFRALKVADKIREIKAFLNSPKILTLYQDMVRPELVDVQDLTVFIEAPYGSQREKAVFEELHLVGIETFQEENLNFIPEA